MDKFDVKERFAEMVFTEEEIEKRLSKSSYKKYAECVKESRPLDISVADEIACAMKDWAIEKGATHYTHWFQPMTGVTAEKHDSFLEPSKSGQAIMKFSGKALIKGEADASSFPNGGLRATFEARGYTAWDPTSKPFVMGGSLYIPTVFCSYGGESLDKKTPLLKSMDTLSKQAVRITKLFNNENIEKVIASVGVEQEYFLIDKKAYEQRFDLVTCGRTLFGAKPPKGQELEDHYFGKIKTRVWEYMADLDRELWKLGVYAKTKHNETAPSQHELATVYTYNNIAVDQNQITMSVMKSVASRHDLVCLLHEKPFRGVNGSGKHNNWSLSTNTGINLLEPGETPYDNLQFLVFISAVISAVDKHQDLLRISVASAGNDMRLGANEAPPAIISMFVGEEIEEIFKSIASGKSYKGKKSSDLEFVSKILPHLPKDKSDRNRTSPFAFTGNKFEFRMVGSDMSVAGANIVLNTIVADELKEIADRLEKAKDFKSEIFQIVKDTYNNHSRILFNGNNYSDEWKKEAEVRGLLNFPTTADALPHYADKKNIELFERHGVFTESEVKSRLEILLDKYAKTIDIEAKTTVYIVRREIIPASIEFEKSVLKELSLKKEVGLKLKNNGEQKLIEKLSSLVDDLCVSTDKLEKDVEKASTITGSEKSAVFHKNTVCKDMEKVRTISDELEKIVGKNYWPFPAYIELLNSVKY